MMADDDDMTVGGNTIGSPSRSVSPSTQQMTTEFTHQDSHHSPSRSVKAVPHLPPFKGTLVGGDVHSPSRLNFDGVAGRPVNEKCLRLKETPVRLQVLYCMSCLFIEDVHHV
jgi:hypothetical protein